MFTFSAIQYRHIESNQIIKIEPNSNVISNPDPNNISHEIHTNRSLIPETKEVHMEQQKIHKLDAIVSIQNKNNKMLV